MHKFKQLVNRHIVSCSILTLNLLNFLNGIIHLLFLELSIFILGISRRELKSWSANSIEPGVQACHHF